ncbi:MAG: HAD-IC family P-type ATPase [archaeon]
MEKENNNRNQYWAIEKEEVVKHFQSTVSGLSQKEAELRLERYGKNIIQETNKINPWKIFFSQFKSFLVYILLIAAGISLVIQHYLDSSVIFAIVLLNAGIGFFQQYKAEKSILELKKLLVPKTQVMRDKKLHEISSQNIVPGDIIIFDEGDKITADCRIIEIDNLEVNEAVLTGESLPIEKIESRIRPDTMLANRKNMLYTGTTVVKGRCTALVISTGMSTEFGKIASTLQEISVQETPMQKKLDYFAKQISLVVLLIVALMIAFGILTGQDKVEMFLIAVALAVSAIPEGLPAVITISLAYAANSMLKNRVIVRRLPAAETMGSVTVICSDKTGTLTEERMSVTNIFCNNKHYSKQEGTLIHGKNKVDPKKDKSLSQLFQASLLCNNARFELRDSASRDDCEYDILGDPTEAALVLSGLDVGISKKALSEAQPRMKEISFTSTRKMMSIIRKGERHHLLYAKGAATVILEKSAYEFINGRIEKLSENKKKLLSKQAESMESQALRVLAFASRNLTSTDLKNLKENAEELEKGLIFLGFIGMLDPPRKEIKEAIRLSKAAGVEVKIITGDSPLTARAIAKQVGLSGNMIIGSELERMTDERLKNEINNITIFARINPMQKLRIVDILKIKNEIVAITGDGVNDVLALKKADIGISMGIRGSDVAREVSDMILLDDNFASIVKANEQGRIVYDNTKKITKYLLAVNFSEILLISYAILARLPLPLLPLHILWMNLITDSIPALALVKEPGEDVMSTSPRKEKSILHGILPFLIIAGIVTFLAELAVFLISIHLGHDIIKTRSLVLATSILFQLFFIFTCRSDKKLTEIGVFSNKYLVYAFIISLILTLAVLYTPLASLFKLTSISPKEWLLVLPFSLSGVILFEARKFFPKIKKRKNAAK